MNRRSVICIRKANRLAYSSEVERNIRRFSSFADADKADRDFYKKLTGNERVQICIELSDQDIDTPLERVAVIRKVSDVTARDVITLPRD
jgi:hypothetical protein